MADKDKDHTLQDEKGRFVPGHPKRGGSKVGYRKSRNVLSEQLYPFYEHMGELIATIEDPYDQVRAVALMSRFTMPTLASVDYREKAQRNLSAEEELVKINLRFEGKVDPTTEKGEEDDDEE